VRFNKLVENILEAVGDVPPPPPAQIQQHVDTKLTFDDIFDLIKDHEGYRPKVYKDSLGIPTIGIGFNLMRPDARNICNRVGVDYDNILSGNQILTDNQIKEIFKITLKIAYDDAKKWLPNFDGLPKNIKLAVIDLSFNMGYNRLSKFIKTKNFLVNGEYKLAASELKNSKWATQVGRRVNSVVNLLTS